MSEIFLLLGPEKGKKQKFLKDTIRKISQQKGGEAEIHRFYPFESEMENILSTAGNGSLFSAHLIILVNQAETIKTKDAKLFSEYLKKPNADASFFFISDETAATKISSPITKAIPKKNTVVFWELFESDKKSWLINFFRKQNLQITPEGVEYLLEMLENNTSEFQTVCRQIAAFHEPGSTLTPESMEEFLYHSKEETVFSLFARIAECDFQSSLDILKKISLGGSVFYPQLVGGLLWQLKKMISWSELASQHYSADEICKKLGVRGKRARQQYQNAMRHYNGRQLKQMLILSTRVDSLLRESRSELQLLLMELYLYYLVVKKGDASSLEMVLN